MLDPPNGPATASAILAIVSISADRYQYRFATIPGEGLEPSEPSGSIRRRRWPSAYGLSGFVGKLRQDPPGISGRILIRRVVGF